MDERDRLSATSKDDLEKQARERLESDLRYQYLDTHEKLEAALKEIRRLSPLDLRAQEAFAERDRAQERRRAAEQARDAAESRARLAESRARIAEEDLATLKRRLEFVEDDLVSRISALLADVRELV